MACIDTLSIPNIITKLHIGAHLMTWTFYVPNLQLYNLRILIHDTVGDLEYTPAGHTCTSMLDMRIPMHILTNTISISIG